jgi:capsular polysaccharide biosynthesis protein
MRAAQYIALIRANWLLIGLLALFGSVGLGALAHQREPAYRSEIHLLVSFTPPPERPSSEVDLLMQRRVKTYAGMLTTPRVTGPVVESLRLPVTPDRLGDDITASSPVDSHAIDVTVTDSIPDRAAAIGNALAAELAKAAAGESERAKERTEPKAGSPMVAKISVTTPASVPDGPVAVRWRLHAAAGALAGAALGLGLAVLRRHPGAPARGGDSAVSKTERPSNE